MNRIIITFFCLLSSIVLVSQTSYDYETVLSELKNPEILLNIEIFLHTEDFSIYIENEIKEPTYLMHESCGNVKSDYSKNISIQESLIENDLVKYIYKFRLDEIVRIDSNLPDLLIDRIGNLTVEYKTDRGTKSIVIPLLKNEISKNFIRELKLIFPGEKCLFELEELLRT